MNTSDFSYGFRYMDGLDAFIVLHVQQAISLRILFIEICGVLLLSL